MSETRRAQAGLLALLAALIAGPVSAADWTLEPLRDEAFERGFYVPTDLGDSVAALRRISTPENLAWTRSVSSLEFTATTHHGLGTWIRFHWLFDGSRLKRFFESKGIDSADNASGVVLSAYWRSVRGEPIAEDRLIAQTLLAEKEVWPPEPIRCSEDPEAILKPLFRWFEERPDDGARLVTYAVCPATGAYWAFDVQQGWKPASADQAATIQRHHSESEATPE